MFDESEPQQISHLVQQIIIPLHAPLMWGTSSGLVTSSTDEASCQYAPKNVAGSESSTGMSWIPPFHLTGVISTTL